MPKKSCQQSATIARVDAIMDTDGNTRVPTASRKQVEPMATPTDTSPPASPSGLPGADGILRRFTRDHADHPDLAESLVRGLLMLHDHLRDPGLTAAAEDGERQTLHAVVAKAVHAYPPAAEWIEAECARSAELLGSRRKDGFEIRSGAGASSDPGLDLAFLAADVATDASEDALAVAGELTGRYVAAAADELLGTLAPLHDVLAACSRLGSISDDHRERLLSFITRRMTRPRPPCLIVMCGLPGSGKSTVGGTLAGMVSAAYLSSDIVRKQLADIPPRARTNTAYQEGLYTPAMSRRTFAELRRRVVSHLEAGVPVVVEAVHARVRERRHMHTIAVRLGVPILFVELRVTERELLRRLDARASDPLRISDADESIYRSFRNSFEPFAKHEYPGCLADAERSPFEIATTIEQALDIYPLTRRD